MAPLLPSARWAYMPLRLLPPAAAGLGLLAILGPRLPSDEPRVQATAIGGLLLVLCALALEFGGWARTLQSRPRPLAAAALLGAVVSACGLLVVGWTSGGSAMVPEIARRDRSDDRSPDASPRPVELARRSH